jgi:alcohol dehydrogenase class IV
VNKEGELMQTVRLLQPQKILFGPGCAAQCAADLVALGMERALIITSPPIVGLAAPVADVLRQGGCAVEVYSGIAEEPSITMFELTLEAARLAKPQVVVGLGGGSAMDVAKLVAALYDGAGVQDVREILGLNLLRSRALHLVCLPTTSGTGSEVSPNAILLDEAERLKKAAVSPYLMPDAAYVDPALTLTVPPGVTAATGLDALTHCIETFANRVAHPMVDLYALQGMRLIAGSLRRAVRNGDDLEARTNMAMGSLYGGLGLAPVNTAAVHALAYPLGSEFHVAHGVSNAVLLPHVLRFNLPAAPERYAAMALALGVEAGGSALETAQRGVDWIGELCRECGIPAGLAALGVPAEAIPGMALAAMKVTRLLKNNLRQVTAADAEAIYRAAFD